VAARAGGILRILESAVEARRLVDVVGDVLVTVKAQRTLSSPLETLMTPGAIAFVLRVPFDHLSRHNQGFDLGVSRFLSEYRQSHHYSSEKKSISHAAHITDFNTYEPRARAPVPTTPS
jgi:hypothetical protein